MPKISCLLLLLISCVLSADQIVRLIPPQISRESVDEQIVCTRPTREGKINIAVEQKSGQTVVHCYGHGGAGWTTLFGSVQRSIELFALTAPDKDIPIRVVGAGCMGLTAAIELNRLGYRVAGISTKSRCDTPSWKAAGYFALLALITSPEEQQVLDAISLNTLYAYQAIKRGEHPYLTSDTVKFMPVYSSVATEAGIERLEESGILPPYEAVTLDFGNGVIHHDYVQRWTYFMNTSTIMQQLTAEVERLGIPIEIGEVTSFSDLTEEVVFNCTGLGSKELNGDTQMVPVRGHLVTLNDSAGSAHMEYMIYTKVLQEDKEEYIYLFPKNFSVTSDSAPGVPCAGVLGERLFPMSIVCRRQSKKR